MLDNIHWCVVENSAFWELKKFTSEGVWEDHTRLISWDTVNFFREVYRRCRGE